MADSEGPGGFDHLEAAWRLRDDAFEDAIFRGVDISKRNRRYNENFSPDPQVWLTNKRMSQTEVSLRLGRFLLESPIVYGTVMVTLAGYELTRTEHPQFPVRRYLVERLGFAPKVNRPTKWRGHYNRPGIDRTLFVTFNVHAGHLSAPLATGGRLIVFVSAGPTDSKRGSIEHRLLHSAIGRAVAWRGAKPTDEIAVCVPRSAPFRRVIDDFQKADRLQRLGLHLLTVDRITGTVSGRGALETICKRS